ncbi:hypothetical protein GCU56_21675 [Geodermatophilus sabuli]|uniref:Uncharacterized protein n=1 Tax=Geodermatophilus sabuli TaxID=1564158 RepID=A0A7K3W6L9_9ACTN|nr:hypothetical protein [Geodermatophilus sabuli]NEK60472.1 hypothetical protein [Geodermatophilus sabuli]
MGKRSLSTGFATNPGIQVLLAVLVVGTIGLLVRDVLAEDRSSLDIAIRAATAISWAVILAAGVIGRRRQRREQAATCDDPGRDHRAPTG